MLPSPSPLAQQSRRTLGGDIVKDAKSERGVLKADVVHDSQSTQKRVVDMEDVIELTDSDPDDALPKATQLLPHTSKIPSSYKTPVHQLPPSLNHFAFQPKPTKMVSRFMSTATSQKVQRPSDSTTEKGKTAYSWKKKHACAVNGGGRRERLRPRNLNTSRKELKLPTETRVGELPAALNTHLEDVVQEALPKKKGRRKEVGSTVCEYNSETRKAMLQRARAILGPAVNLDEIGGMPAFAASTQAVQLPRRALASGNGVSTSDPPLSPTWTFLPSKLKFQAQMDVGREIPLSLVSRENLLLHLGSTNNNERDISVDATRDYSTSPPDIQCLVEPKNTFLLSNEKTLAREIPKESVSPAVRDNKRVSGSSDSSESGFTDPPKRRRGRPPSGSSSRANAKQKRQEREKRQSAAFEQWQEELWTKIVEDIDHYKRILRYEPIHFDTFQNLVPPSGTPATLRKKIVDFLDQQAINYYGYNMSNMLRKHKHRRKGSSSRRSKTP